MLSAQAADVCISRHQETGHSSSFAAKVDVLFSELVVLQVVAWYDNEWGYSQRVVDLAEITAKNWE